MDAGRARIAGLAALIALSGLPAAGASGGDPLERLVAGLRGLPDVDDPNDDGQPADAVEDLARRLSLDPPDPERPDPAAPPPVDDEGFASALRDRRDYRAFKAFAFAADAKGRRVYACVHELPDERIAIERAPADGTVRAARTRVGAPCRLRAVGDRVVADRRDPAPARTP